MQLLDEVEVNYFYYVNCLTVQINSIQTHKTNNPLGATCKTFFLKTADTVLLQLRYGQHLEN